MKSLFGHDPVPPSLGETALAGELKWIITRHHFQHQLLCDSMIFKDYLRRVIFR